MMRRLLQAEVDEAGGADVLYPPLEGQGLFALIANLNHSCEPSAVVVPTYLVQQ
eukprot:COSAG05_NODE_1194_length_5568_cov_26.075878_4_plen_54_part_00